MCDLAGTMAASKTIKTVDDYDDDNGNTTSITTITTITFSCCGAATQRGSWPPHS